MLNGENLQTKMIIIIGNLVTSNEIVLAQFGCIILFAISEQVMHTHIFYIAICKHNTLNKHGVLLSGLFNLCAFKYIVFGSKKSMIINIEIIINDLYYTHIAQN